MILFIYFIKKYLKKGNLYKSMKLIIYILYFLKQINQNSGIYIFTKAIKNLLLPFNFIKLKKNAITYNIPIIISYEQSIYNVYILLNMYLQKKNQLLYKSICKYIILSYNKEGDLYKKKLFLIKQFLNNRAYIYLLKNK